MPADAAPSWMWAPELGGPGARLAWNEDDLHYLRRVCRARPGDHVTVTDGRGVVAVVTLEDGPALEGRIESVERRTRAREAWILCGAPEGDRADWMVEKLAELGIARLVPIQCARARWDESGKRMARWSRLTTAALRQSRQPFRMELLAPVSLADAIRGLSGSSSRWLADPAGPRGATPGAAASPAACAVGPSPGFEDAEWVRLREAGFEPIGLSESRLRTETAAIAWAAWWGTG